MLQANRTLPPELLGYDAQAKLIALDSAYGIVEFDLAGNIVLVNDLFCSFVGYRKEALIGAPHTMLLTPTDRVQHNGFWQPMDTLRDKNYLEELWASGKAPWKGWK